MRQSNGFWPDWNGRWEVQRGHCVATLLQSAATLGKQLATFTVPSCANFHTSTINMNFVYSQLGQQNERSLQIWVELIDLEWLGAVSHLGCVCLWVHSLRQHITHTPRVTLQVANICHCLPVWQLVHAWPVCPSSQTHYIHYIHTIYTIYTRYVLYKLQTAGMTVFYGRNSLSGSRNFVELACRTENLLLFMTKILEFIGSFARRFVLIAAH